MGGNDDALNANKEKEKKGRQMFFAGYLNPSTAACWIVILCPPLSLFIDLTLLKPDTYVFSPFLCTQFFFQVINFQNLIQFINKLFQIFKSTVYILR